MKIFYVPLEPYKERYTVQLSAPKTGWLERNWVKHDISYHRVEGKTVNNNKSISTGSVLDAIGRGYWSCSQIQELLVLLQNGELTSDDVIYFDDFWTPGIEALPYAFDLYNIHPRMYSMLHAQSVDQFDFTYPMRKWIRHFEKGIAQIMSGIFITSTCLRDLCLYHGLGTEENLHICGLPYNSEEVIEHMPYNPKTDLKSVIENKKRQVVFSSRFDSEKCPHFLMDVIENSIFKNTGIKFVITTSSDKIRSNDLTAIKRLEKLKKYPELEVREGLTKKQYYETLLESMVQLNTADQDFVSWTLLEATTCRCHPVYPYFLSFPEVLKDHKYMYVKNDIESCIIKIQRGLDNWTPSHNQIYEPFDSSWYRMLCVMKGEEYEPLY